MKFFKLDKRNNKWIETACIDSYKADYNFSNIDKLAYKLGYTRVYSSVTKRLTQNFYYMADCAKVKSPLYQLYSNRNYYLVNTDADAMEYVYFSCSQQKLDSFTNAELYSAYELYRCEDCGQLVRARNAIKVGRNHIYCSDCVNKHAKKCYICGTWYMKQSSLTTYNLIENSEPVNVCNHCKARFEMSLGTCADCGGLTRNYRRIRGQLYCYNCYERHDVPNLIASYHCGHMDITKQFATTETPAEDLLCVGPEIEFETTSEPRFAVYDVNEILNKDTQLAKFEHDGSLHNGAEIILQPCTPNWHYENAEKMQNVFKALQDNNCSYKSGTRDTCGLHIHINRSFFKDYDYENRFCYLFQRLKDKIRVLSQRKEYSYCAFATGSTSWDNIFSQKQHQMQGHGSAINCSNRNTIEVRIFRGTTDYNTFMAYIEFVRNFATLVRDNTDIAQIERTTFEDVINYCNNKYLNAYCQSLGLLGGAC